MTDILGPANAPYAVTTRPADTRTFGTDDSWFKDCTDAAVEDGTDIQASWLNNVAAALRNLWRMNGNLIDGITKLVPESGVDDFGLAKAVQQTVQRGQVIFGNDTGAANSVIVSLAPAALEYKAGLALRVKIAATNTGATKINVNGLGLRDVTRRNGSMLLDSDLISGEIAEVVYDGTKFIVPAARGQAQLSRNLTLYVNGTTGNDANDGLIGTPLATIQGAVNRAFSYGPGPYKVSVLVADFAGYGPVTVPIQAGPRVEISGNSVSPANVVVSGGSDHCFYVQGPNVVAVSNLKVVNGAGAANGGFVASSGGHIITSNTISGAITGAVFEAYGSGSAIDVGSHIYSGSGLYFLWAINGGVVSPVANAVFTISAPISVTYSAISMTGGGIPFNPSPATWVNPLNVTGGKFSAYLNGYINTLGSGIDYLPGSTAGITGTGGQYA